MNDQGEITCSVDARGRTAEDREMDDEDASVVRQMDDDDEQELVENYSPETKTYKRRWYILGVFSLLCCHQITLWNTFGPIERSVRYAYPNWTSGTVAFISNWGAIVFVVTVVPTCWLVERYGLRAVVIASSGFLAAGALVRVFSVHPDAFLITSNVGAILVGFCGVVVMSAPAAVSAAWFPPTQRTTATSVSQAITSLGNGVSFFVGPLLVPDNFLNGTDSSDGHVHVLQNYTGKVYSPEEVRMQIWRYMAGDASFAVLIFISMLVYFPSKPKIPPSHSASMQAERTEFVRGLKSLLSNPSVMLCWAAFSLSGGCLASFLSIMTIIFEIIDVSDEQSGNIGVVAVVASIVMALAVAELTDHIRKHIKLTLVVLALMATGCFTWLTIIIIKVTPFQLWQLYVSVVGGSSFLFATFPLFYEYTIELAFPVSENLVGGLLSGGLNLVAAVFLSIFCIPNLSYVWMNYAAAACSFSIVPFVLLTKESYSRLEMDQ